MAMGPVKRCKNMTNKMAILSAARNRSGHRLNNSLIKSEPAMSEHLRSKRRFLNMERNEQRTTASRRKFLKRLLLYGSLFAAVTVSGFGIFSLAERIGSTTTNTPSTTSTPTIGTKQEILDPATNSVVRTSDIAENEAINFIYPRTGDPSKDSNTFSQCVVIHLPKGFSAGNFGAKDPISGDTFIAFSRVCVHLWCLCSYDTSNDLITCPCHGSQYVPGFGAPYNDEPGFAVSGPAASQPAPNNTLPVVTLSVASDGTLSATGVIGTIGCGQGCATAKSSSTSMNQQL
jgi:Rieske Fe-S protein